MGFSLVGTSANRRCRDTLRYKHGDLIGSTQWLTDHNGAVDNPMTTLAYTAFGEAVGDDSGAFSRYRYAGGHGYESDLLTLDGASGTDPVTLLHVGERWYQPGIGRFVQRDPIGIAGGLNVYLYMANNPLGGADPMGLQPSDYPFGIPPEPHPGHDEAVVAGTTLLIVGGFCTAGPLGGGLAAAGTVLWAHDEWIRFFIDDARRPRNPTRTRPRDMLDPRPTSDGSNHLKNEPRSSIIQSPTPALYERIDTEAGGVEFGIKWRWLSL